MPGLPFYFNKTGVVCVVYIGEKMQPSNALSASKNRLSELSIAAWTGRVTTLA